MKNLTYNYKWEKNLWKNKTYVENIFILDSNFQKNQSFKNWIYTFYNENISKFNLDYHSYFINDK